MMNEVVTKAVQSSSALGCPVLVLHQCLQESLGGTRFAAPHKPIVGTAVCEVKNFFVRRTTGH